MVDPIFGKAAISAMSPTARGARKLITSRRHHDCLASFLRAATEAAVERSDHATKVHVGPVIDATTEAAMKVAVRSSSGMVPKGLRRAVEPAAWLQRKTPNPFVYTTATWANVLRRWMLEALPQGSYQRGTLASRIEEEWSDAVNRIINGQGTSETCRLYGQDLLQALEQNDQRAFDRDQKAVRKMVSVAVGASGLAAIGLAGGDIADGSAGTAATVVGGVGVASLAAALWLGRRAQRSPEWDEVAAVAIALEAAREWISDVRDSNLWPTLSARDQRPAARLVRSALWTRRRLLASLRDRVIPRLVRADVSPLLVALLERVGDHLQDGTTGGGTAELEKLFDQVDMMLGPVDTGI
jgi:hypothetical protein